MRVSFIPHDGLVLAVKWATPRVNHDGSLVFQPLTRGFTYDLSDTAVCLTRFHAAPDPDCACGFYAVSDPRFLLSAAGPWPWRGALLEVDLSGLVVSHAHRLPHRSNVFARLWSFLAPRAVVLPPDSQELASNVDALVFRAENQRVANIVLPSCCHFCEETPVAVGFSNASSGFLLPVCSTHASPSAVDPLVFAARYACDLHFAPAEFYQSCRLRKPTVWQNLFVTVPSAIAAAIISFLVLLSLLGPFDTVVPALGLFGALLALFFLGFFTLARFGPPLWPPPRDFFVDSPDVSAKLPLLASLTSAPLADAEPKDPQAVFDADAPPDHPIPNAVQEEDPET